MVHSKTLITSPLKSKKWRGSACMARNSSVQRVQMKIGTLHVISIYYSRYSRLHLENSHMSSKVVVGESNEYQQIFVGCVPPSMATGVQEALQTSASIHSTYGLPDMANQFKPGSLAKRTN